MIPLLITALLSFGLLVWAAAAVQTEIHLGASAITALAFAAFAVLRAPPVAAAGVGAGGHAAHAAHAAMTANSMSVVWWWGGATLLASYLFFVTWPEWWQFCLGFLVLGVLTSGFSAMMARDAASGRNDEALLKLGRWLTIGQLVGMILTMVGLVIDGKMTHFLDIRKGWEDWAANNIFFFGALALALISIHALWTAPKVRADVDRTTGGDRQEGTS